MFGWIKIHRKMLDWEWYSDINVFRLFTHLLLAVNHQDKRWRGQIVKAGEVITSLSKLAEQTGLTVQQVRTSINKLKSTRELTSKNTNKFTLISIVCWDEYQDVNTPPNKQITNKQQTNNKQITTTKERKNDKNDKKKEKINKKKPTLEDLSVDHIADWLAEKRNKGIYNTHDEHQVLETFKDYCKAKGKTYADYQAAYRNSFTWQRNQPQAANSGFTGRNLTGPGTQTPSTTENVLAAYAAAVVE